MRGSYNTRNKPWFRLNVSEYLESFFARLRRFKIL